MKCLYCDEDYYINSSIKRYLLSNDPLCEKCRKSLTYRPKSFEIVGVKGRAFYVYDEAFRSMIIAYKEAYDEALASIFLAPFIDYINLRYRDYVLVFAPSSEENIKRRGFNHLDLMCKGLKLKKMNILYKNEDINQNLKNHKDRGLIKDYIKLKDNVKLDKVLLVDDVLTSGSTMKTCIELLKPNSRKISFISLGYSRQCPDKI